MNLRRAAGFAAILLLALPSAASASPIDTGGTDGQVVTGTKLITAVGGDALSGAISVRFADSDVALFYEDDSGVDPSQAPGNFAIHEHGTPYSSQGTAFTPVSPAVVTGSGSVASPWAVTSAFATPDLSIAQTVTHVDGSRALTLKWKVSNTSGASVPFSAFWSADLYVSGSDEGTGALVAGPPRTLQGIAIDGTKVGLIELTPWSHYYEGDWWTATAPSWDDSALYNDTFDPTSLDNGFGVSWNRSLAPGASTTLILGFGASEPGGAPVPAVAPDITRSPVSGPSHSATFAFHAHAGDTATVSFECSIDGGLFNPCTSPAAFSGLHLGEHAFRVHGLNSDGDFGPAALANWTVQPAQPAGHSRRPVGLRPVTVAGSTVKAACKLGSGQIARCSVTLVSPSGVVVGRGVRVFTGSHQRRTGKVEVVLTAAGRRLAARPGGVRVVATAQITPVAGSPVVVHQTAHVVARLVDLTPAALQFQSGSAVLLPSGASYLGTLASQLAGATRVLATGYTDDLGNAGANYRLGLARADAVCAFLSHRAHVACTAVSYGESHPRATNATAAGRALNRRVELRLTY